MLNVIQESRITPHIFMTNPKLTLPAAVQLYSGELFQLVDGLLEPWGNQDMRVRCFMLFVNIVNHNTSVLCWTSQSLPQTSGPQALISASLWQECVQFCEAEIVIFEDEAVVLGRTEQNHVYIDTR